MSEDKITRRDFIKNLSTGMALVSGSASSIVLFPTCEKTAKKQDTGKIENGRYVREINEKKYRVYFGDLHVHSCISPDVWHKEDIPDVLYKYAIEVAKLDFTAMTDHDSPPGLNTSSGEEWAMACEAVRKYYKPYEFVTFHAYEWTSGNGLITLSDYLAGKDRWAYLKDPTLFGHRNVYFPKDFVPDRVFAVENEESNTPEKLWELLKPYGAITIPHHPLGGPVPPLKWEHRNEEMETLVEIYSLHGNSEADECPLRIYNPYLNEIHSVKYAISTGYHLGFIGSSDSHRAKPGNQNYDDEDMIQLLIDNYKGERRKGAGLACVYAEELTRDSLWDAFMKRRTYATTGEKIFLDVTVDGRFMGSEITTGKGVKIITRVIGTKPVLKIEILKNSEVVQILDGSKEDELTEFDDLKAEEGTAYYYVRITQEDGEMAWSSPVYVNYK